MKKLLFSAQIILAGLFIFSLLAIVFQLSGNYNPLSRYNYKAPLFKRVEEYDPSLSRLNSMRKLEQYCDSLYAEKVVKGNAGEFEKGYTDVVSAVIRKRFFHGYSYYGFNDNYMAMLVSTSTVKGLGAIVIPDDILAYPFAACSQQSIVMMEALKAKGFKMMEALKAKGFKTRKISFYGKNFGGHFSFEVFYHGSWHFYDPNMEPDMAVLNAYDKPGIAFLVNNPNILVKAYSRYPSEEIVDIFPTYSYGAVNKFPAPRAIILQKLTKCLSYINWLIFLLIFFIVRRKYLRISSKNHVWNSRIYFPQSETGTSSSYYPGLTAPGA